MWIVYRLDVILFSSFRFVFLCYTIELWRNREKRKTDFLSFFLFWFDAKKKGKLIEININYKVSFFNSLLQYWIVYRFYFLPFDRFPFVIPSNYGGIAKNVEPIFFRFFFFLDLKQRKKKLIEVNINHKVSFFNSLLQC